MLDVAIATHPATSPAVLAALLSAPAAHPLARSIAKVLLNDSGMPWSDIRSHRLEDDLFILNHPRLSAPQRRSYLSCGQGQSWMSFIGTPSASAEDITHIVNQNAPSGPKVSGYQVWAYEVPRAPNTPTHIAQTFNDILWDVLAQPRLRASGFTPEVVVTSLDTHGLDPRHLLHQLGTHPATWARGYTEAIRTWCEHGSDLVTALNTRGRTTSLHSDRLGGLEWLAMLAHTGRTELAQSALALSPTPTVASTILHNPRLASTAHQAAVGVLLRSDSRYLRYAWAYLHEHGPNLPADLIDLAVATAAQNPLDGPLVGTVGNNARPLDFVGTAPQATPAQLTGAWACLRSNTVRSSAGQNRSADRHALTDTERALFDLGFHANATTEQRTEAASALRSEHSRTWVRSALIRLGDPTASDADCVPLPALAALRALPPAVGFGYVAPPAATLGRLVQASLTRHQRALRDPDVALTVTTMATTFRGALGQLLRVAETIAGPS